MTQYLNCACVIHGNAYDWSYVENLHAMIARNVSREVRMHVFTEAARSVPPHMIKHSLQEWPEVSNTRRAWWYKMQMFDPVHDLGTVLYFDLDVVICGSLDWLLALDTQYFWTINDWRHLWKPHWKGMNSSMMYWDHAKFSEPWNHFNQTELKEVIRNYRGDQDFLNKALPENRMRYFNDPLIRSWRWQIKDGGIDPKTKRYARPGAGSIVPDDPAVMVFHGQPKPLEIDDGLIIRFWHTSLI